MNKLLQSEADIKQDSCNKKKSDRIKKSCTL